MTEHSIQARVIQFVRTFYPDVIIYSIPNGAHTSGKNRLRLAREGLLAGIPDVCLAEPKNGFHGLYIEFKTDNGKASDKQNDVITRLMHKGYLCYVARSHTTAIDIIQDYLRSNHAISA